MILDATLRLEAKLDASASVAAHVHVDYVQWNKENEITKPATYRTVISSSGDVIILPIPPQEFVSEPIRFTVYNGNNLNAINVTIKTDDGSTERTICKSTLSADETLCWEKGSGFQVIP